MFHNIYFLTITNIYIYIYFFFNVLSFRHIYLTFSKCILVFFTLNKLQSVANYVIYYGNCIYFKQSEFFKKRNINGIQVFVLKLY